MKKFLSIALLISISTIFMGCISEPQLTATKDGKLYVRALIDGQDIIYFRGNTMWIQHINHQLPGFYNGSQTPIYVNENGKWNPTWNKNLSDSYTFDTNAPIPSKGTWDSSNVSFKYFTTDLGKAEVVAYPSEKNDYTLAIKVNDYEQDGAHWYVFNIDWDDTSK